ncbi:MAG: enoyl-CoA hydratase/isomerase family protein [Candidatus Hydrogenedentes bacterium]|nr:enoyl-CoA hydratase/isomerase family protein [Candidatus Hydrogenedentota bacterium]
MATYQTILVDRPEDGIAVLTLDRPKSLNAITWEMVEELHDCYSAFEDDLDTRVVILTGAGRGFCSGTDLKAGRDTHEKDEAPDISGMMRRQRRIADLSIHMRKIPQPIVAAVNGVAAGGGFSFAMACDVRVAAESARFICSFINIGLSSGDVGSSYWLPRLVGFSQAAELLYSGRSLYAQEAKEMGLVSKVVPDGGAMDAAVETARTMLGKGPFGLRMTKELLNHSFDAPSLEAALYMENRTQALAVLKGDFTEAIAAFKEKRPPKFPKEQG